MKPYYEQDGITIYHGDCREVLSLNSITSGDIPAVDVVVTDPPYGIEHGSQPIQGGRVRPRNGKSAAPINDWHPPSDWDASIDPEWGELVCKLAPVVAWFGQWRKREEVERLMPHRLRCELIWAKDTHVGPPCPAAPRDERIWIFSRDGLKPTRFETTVWDVPIIPTWAHRFHKNEKPEALMLRLCSWLPIGAIGDPFMGSGTTLVAAKRLGRKAVGVEIDERFCEMAAKRLSQGALPLEVA